MLNKKHGTSEGNAKKIIGVLGGCGVTQNQIAARLGISESAVYCVIRGRSRSQRVINYLVGLGCQPDWFRPSRLFLGNSKKINDTLLACGIGRKHVADAVGVSVEMIGYVVRGEVRSQRVINHLVGLGCQPDWFKPAERRGRKPKQTS